MNKPCYNDSLCLHEYSKLIGLKKKATFVRSGKVERVSAFQRNRNFRKVFVNKTFTHVQEQKKAMSPRHSGYGIVWRKITLKWDLIISEIQPLD